MQVLTHEERILSRCRDIFSGRNVTFEFAAETCGISLEGFMVHYDAYVRRLTRAIETQQEWFLLYELEYLLRAGYMRPDEASKRFKVPQEGIEKWTESQGGIKKDLSWRNVRFLQVEQKEQENSDGKN